MENHSGTSQEYLTGSTVSYNTVGGVSVTSDNKTAAVVALNKASNVSRAVFDGADAVVIDGVRVPISDDVQIYNADTLQWTTLSAAKAYADTFTIYYSGSLGSDAKVRVIFTSIINPQISPKPLQSRIPYSRHINGTTPKHVPNCLGVVLSYLDYLAVLNW